MYKNVMNKL